tara:strand:+ start:20531 stop:22711 length:2181 start_codon:yes stop_codon:yes gene_type:complete
MTGLDSIATQLFEKIRSRFPKIVMGDENGAPTSDEGTARFYDFDWVVNGENQGAVSISISEAESLKVYYSQNMLENLPEPIENEWYNFLKEMRFFAKKHMMGFDTRDIAKSNLDKRDYQYLANKQVQESTMYGTTKSSYEELDKTKLIIRHKKEITPEQSGARTRHISSLFIENESGERFKYPFAHLAGARAMARHVANSGVPHDDFGKHIIATSENIAKLTAFKRFVGKKDFMNTTSNDIIEGSNVELDYMRSHLKKLQGQGYYAQSKENFIPVESTGEELGEDIVNDLTNAFTIPQFNEELKDMFPLLHSIHQKRVAETTVSLDDVLDESNDDIIFKGKQIDTDTIEYDMQDPSDLLFVLDSGMKYTDGTEVDDDDLEELDQLPAMIDWIAVDYNDRLHDQADMQRDMERERFETSNTPEDEFEEWADSVIDEALDKQRIDMLNKMISKSLPVGPDATNAINSLKGIIEDEGLMNELKSLAESDPESCARPAIYRYLKQNDPEALDDLDFGDMTMEDDDDTTDVTIDKDGAMKLAGDDEEPKDEKASTEDIIEFVRSFYDTETGAFPKGETGVVISARKRFGDSVGDLVEKFVSKLTGNKVQVEDDQDVEEGSIKYMHSLKAKGHSDEEIAKELNMSADEVKQALSKTVEDEEKDNKGYTDKEIKMAFGVLNDKRFKGGNYTGAVEVIEKIAKGLSQHPSVVKALQRTNEDLAYIKDKLAKLIR